MKSMSFEDREYKPVVPSADTESLSDSGARLILSHDDGPTIFWAEPGSLYSGWVIGIERK